MKHPLPPDDMPSFLAAHEIYEFLHETIFNKHSEYFNEDHQHLFEMQPHELAFMWADGGFEKARKYVIGECEKVQFMAGGWKRERQIMWFRMIFNDVPEFLITLDARYCRDCTKHQFMSLLEHELYHIVQKLNQYGEPAFKANGRPSLEIIGHDVEEFSAVVKRYGGDDDVNEMVDMAKQKPLFSDE